MKFAFLILIFNIVLIVSFLCIFLLPFSVFGDSFLPDSLQANGILTGIFLSIGIFVNVLLVSNARFFIALEKEDWNALIEVLEFRLYKKNKVRNLYVTLLCNTYVLMSRFDALERLEAHVKSKSVSVYSANLMRFAAVAVLNKNFRRARLMLGESLYYTPATKDWCSWYLGLISFLEKDFVSAIETFGTLQNSCTNPVVAALCAFLLENRLVEEEAGVYEKYTDVVQECKKELRAKYSRAKWVRLIKSEKTEIYGVTIGSLLDSTVSYLFV